MKTFPRKRPSDDELIEESAADWLARRDGGLTDAEQREFDRWRAADPRHAAAFARVESTWSALLQLRQYRPTARALPDRDLLAPRRNRRRLRFPRALLVAATAAAAAVAALWYRPAALPSIASASPEIYSTTVGGYQRVTLSDGSILQLNDSSEVRVAFTPAERHLQLLRGQAHFTVTKNKQRPFIVETGGVTVRAVGTAFDVRLNDAHVEVLVTEGVVQLGRADSGTQPAAASATPAAPLLTAGWHASVPHRFSAAPTLEQMDPARLREALSWQGPRLVFAETPLAEVIAQFNRRNRIQLALGDPTLADLPVGGSFRAENVEAFVRLLTSSGDISAEQNGDRFILRKVR